MLLNAMGWMLASITLAACGGGGATATPSAVTLHATSALEVHLVGKPLTFDANCPDATSYVWQWGLGGPADVTATGAAIHTFSVAGTYVVFMECSNARGPIGAAKREITIDELYVSATYDAGTDRFDFEAHCPTASQFAWQWDDGTNTQASTNRADHIYSNAGTFNVTVECRNSRGQEIGQLKKSINLEPRVVQPRPVHSGFTPGVVSVFVGREVTLEVSCPTGSGSVWRWGDGTQSVSDSNLATHTYVGGSGYYRAASAVCFLRGEPAGKGLFEVEAIYLAPGLL